MQCSCIILAEAVNANTCITEGNEHIVKDFIVVSGQTVSRSTKISQLTYLHMAPVQA